MRLIKFFVFSFLIFICLLAIFALTSKAALVGNTTQATLSVSPESGSYNQNGTFTVSVNLNTNGQNVVVAAAYLNYDRNSFQAVSIDTTGSVFTVEAEKIIDSVNGIIKITRGKPTPGVNTASGLIATINFKALYGVTPSADNLTFRFIAGDNTQSTVIKDDGLGTNILSGVYNGRYTVSGDINPSPSPTPSPTPTPTYTPTPTPTPTPTYTPTPTPPPPGGCGSQHYGDGALVRGTGTQKVYVIETCKKRWIPTAEVFNANGYLWNNIIEVSLDELNLYSDGDNIVLIIPPVHKNAPLYKIISSPKVYAIVNGKRHWIPNPTVFSLYGYSWSKVTTVSLATLNQYADVRLLRGLGDPKVYFFTISGQKKWITSQEVFNSYNNNWADVLVVLPSEIDTYPAVTLVRTATDSKVYLLEGTTKRWITTLAVFTRNGYKWENVDTINQTEMDAYQNGSAVE